MYELQQVGPQSYYINCPAKIGIYVQSERYVYLIDSGNDKEAAKKVLKYVLVDSTVRSYLSWMKDRGVLDFTTDNCTLSWKVAE